MNPFHLWLGLPEKSNNPNHYQLLEIKSSERDPKVIEQSAREKLAQLKEVTPQPNHAEAYEKIKQRIIKARSILADKTTRAEYDAKLKSKLAAIKNSKAAADSHPERAADQAPVQAEEVEVLEVAEQSSIAEVLPVNAIPATPDNEEQAEASIPMAVPISPSEQSESPVDESNAGAESFSLTDAVPKDPNDLSIEKGRLKRRKKTWLVPIFGLVLCLAGIGGLVYLVMNYETIIGKRIVVTPIEEDPVEKDPAERPTVETPSTAENVPKTGDVDPTNVDPKVIPKNLSSTDPSKVPTNNDVKYEVLSFDQLVQFRRHMQNARRAMYRRDGKTAELEIQNAQGLFTRFERNDLAISESQKPLQEMADGAGVIPKLLEGFWQQVVTSTIAIPAGQPIVVSGKTLGFVEGTEQFVILRIDGRNVTIPYEFLAPGIAMALAEQGAKKDVPTYRMQQAAFYAVHTHLDPKYKDRAIELAKKAAEDGHDPTPIDNFVNFDSAAVGVPAERADQPPAKQLKTKIPELMVRIGVVSFSRLRPEQAARSVETALEAAVADDDDFRRAMSFEVAYMLAIKAGDIRIVKDVLDEYRLWIKYNYVPRYEQAILDVAKQKLDQRQARLLLSAMLGVAETSEDNRYKKKLVAAGTKVAKNHGLDDFIRRLELATN